MTAQKEKYCRIRAFPVNRQGLFPLNIWLRQNFRPFNRVRSGSRYAGLLQTGIGITAALPCSIGDFLEGLPGFSKDYIINCVQTVFLNGTAIDDLETQLAGTAPTLALSAAMPGLAGAIFRRNSMHAALRSQGAPPSAPQHAGALVRLKLFNKIAEEKGGALLAAGAEVAGAENSWTSSPAIRPCSTRSPALFIAAERWSPAICWAGSGGHRPCISS